MPLCVRLELGGIIVKSETQADRWFFKIADAIVICHCNCYSLDAEVIKMKILYFMLIIISLELIGCNREDKVVAVEPDINPVISVKKVCWFVDGILVNSPDLGNRSQMGGALCQIDSIPVGLVPLVIFAIRKFGDTSSYYAETELADQYAYWYAGILTAGIPMTSKPYTAFYLYCDRGEAGLSFQPEEAILMDNFGRTVKYEKLEKVYMSCPGWEFPLWREEHGRIDGFLFFERLNDHVTEVTIKIPYYSDGERRELDFHFEREVSEEKVHL